MHLPQGRPELDTTVPTVPERAERAGGQGGQVRNGSKLSTSCSVTGSRVPVQCRAGVWSERHLATYVLLRHGKASRGGVRTPGPLGGGLNPLMTGGLNPLVGGLNPLLDEKKKNTRPGV